MERAPRAKRGEIAPGDVVVERDALVIKEREVGRGRRV